MGTAVDRADAELKVTGSARYSAEIKTENLAYAVFVGSRIAKGKIKSINARIAEKESGVLTILTHENAPDIKPTDTFKMGGSTGEGKLPTNTATSVLPLQSPEIF